MEHIDRTVKVCLEFVLEMEKSEKEGNGRVYTGVDVMSNQ